MSKVDKLANQPISDVLIDELTHLLYETTIKSSNPRNDIRRIERDFLEDYVEADTVLCSVCKKTKTVYVRQQWLRVWQQIVRRIEQGQTNTATARGERRSNYTGGDPERSPL